MQIPVAARSKAWDCGRFLPGIAGSNRAGDMCVVYCQVEVSASSWSLIQRCLTECGVSWVSSWSPVRGGIGRIVAVAPCSKDIYILRRMNDDRLRMIKWKRFWPNLRYFPESFVQEIRKTTNRFRGVGNQAQIWIRGICEEGRNREVNEDVMVGRKKDDW